MTSTADPSPGPLYAADSLAHNRDSICRFQRDGGPDVLLRGDGGGVGQRAERRFQSGVGYHPDALMEHCGPLGSLGAERRPIDLDLIASLQIAAGFPSSSAQKKEPDCSGSCSREPRYAAVRYVQMDCEWRGEIRFRITIISPKDPNPSSMRLSVPGSGALTIPMYSCGVPSPLGQPLTGV